MLGSPKTNTHIKRSEINWGCRDLEVKCKAPDPKKPIGIGVNYDTGSTFTRTGQKG